MNETMRRIWMTVTMMLMVTVGAVSAAEPSRWQFEITPYAWLAGLEGDLSLAGRDVQFDKSFGDLFESVELGGSMRLGASYDRFLVGALVDYFSMSVDQIGIQNRPEIGTLDSEMLLTELAVGYRVDGWMEGQTFGLMVGVRNLHLDNDLKLSGIGTFGQGDDITDAMVYVLPSIPILPSRIDGLRFNPVMGVGTGDSDLAYELFPQIHYQITDNMGIRFGYRRVGWQVPGGGNSELDFSLAGLVLGLAVTF